jgi:RecA-family ATPase
MQSSTKIHSGTNNFSENNAKTVHFNPKLSSYRSMTDLAREGKDLAPLKKIWGNYILENSLVWFPSEAGTGKTFLMLQLCIVMQSKHVETFCTEPLQMHGNSLFINAELGEDLMKRRLSDIYRNAPITVNNLDFQSMVYTTRRTFSESRKDIIERVIDLEPTLIVIDNFKTLFRDHDSEKTKSANSLMIELLELKDSFKFSIVVVDHTRKGSRSKLTESDLQSGSGSKTDLADSDFFLRKSSINPRARILKRIKSRNTVEQDKAKLLYFDPETLWFETEDESCDELMHLDPNTIRNAPKEDISALVKSLIEEYGMSLRQIEKKTGIPKSTVSDYSQRGLPF